MPRQPALSCAAPFRSVVSKTTTMILRSCPLGCATKRLKILLLGLVLRLTSRSWQHLERTWLVLVYFPRKAKFCFVTYFRKFVSRVWGKFCFVRWESHAREIGLREIRLSSTTTANAFYLRNGFTACGPPEVAFGVTAFPLIKQLGANPSLNRTRGRV